MPLNREQSIELGFVIDERRAMLLKELADDAAQENAGRDPKSELLAVEAARVRLAEGSYGECVACGADIDYRRLRAAPSAIRCIECQRKFEKAQAGVAQGSTL